MKDRERLEALVVERATRFEPIALVEVLAHLGYRPEEMLFRSHLGSVSQAGFVHGVEFRRHPIRQVVVTLNMGLLGPQSPLPSYWDSLFEQVEIDEEALLAFLRFFDHQLLQRFLLATIPERDPTVFKDFEGIKRSYLRLLGVKSIGTLHWLFERIFPELGVKVDRGALTRVVRLDGTRLGSSILGGGAVLGGWSRMPVPGYHVTMFCDEEHTEFGRPWADEVRRRLDGLVFPAIEEAALDLKVSLVIRSEKVWAQLKPSSYLGFDRIKGGARRNREVQIWKGVVTPETAKTLRTTTRGRA